MQRTTVLHAASIALTGAFVLFALGSGKSKSDTADGGAATAASTAATPAKPAAPKDVDRAAIDKELACAGAKSDMCRIWADFVAATDKPAIPSSGMAVWVGKSFAAGGPKPGYSEYVFLQIVGESTAAPRGVSDSDVLGANAVLRTHEAKGADASDAESLLTALKAGRKAPAFNLFATQTEVKVFTQTPDAVVRTQGTSIAFADEGGTVGWMRKSGNRLLVVEYDPTRTSDHELRTMLGAQPASTPAKVWCTEAWLLQSK